MTRRQGWLRLAAVGAPLVVGGCTDGTGDHTGVAQTRQAVISDQLHSGGTAGFLFLPPMVPRPAQVGDIVYTATPTVRVDEITSAGVTVRTLATFTSNSGPNGERVRVHLQGRPCDPDDDDGDDDPDGYFVARWKTNNAHLSTSALYRARVFVPVRGGGLRELGFADVQVVRSENAFRTVDTQNFTPLREGHVLRIKFRVDRPAVDGDNDGVLDWNDNCPTVANASQLDSLRNGTGDACRCAGVTCVASDACHARGACQPATGTCTNPTVANGTACSIANASATCQAGNCTLGACNAGYANCNGNAADGCEVATNTTTHCGACGRACAGGANATAVCTAGACGIACATGYANCDANAANGCERSISGDNANCGGCGVACTMGQTCQAGACSTAVCASGTADCDHVTTNGCEVTLATNAANCGACGHACSVAHGTAACVAGACAVGTCAAGYGDCNGSAADGCETDLTASASNCGACGNTCATSHATATCNAGACGVGTCNGGWANCDGSSANGCEVSTGDDASNCGGCGVTCSFAHAGATCAGGACALGACGQGYANCDGSPANGCETAPASDVANCGACGHACPSGPHATATCGAGACGIACGHGYADCDGNPSNGCEVNVASDSSNCGACAAACTHATTCQGGACSTSACAAGYADCNHDASDGCEAALGADPGNCGACGSACSFANAAAECSAGACGFSVCNPGFADCDGNRANGCEVNVTSDADHCGGCATACGYANAAATCSGGACAIGACAAGYANCDGSPANGCEVTPGSDVANCGACGHACTAGSNATATCSSGACDITCAAGYADCDGNAANGCERSTGDDDANCGACGRACTQATTCQNGSCTTAVCAAGHADCNHNASDGCEASLGDDPLHCGGCGTPCAFAHAGATCAGGACAMGACNAGYADCDGNAANGCEVDLSDDPAHCGACASACNAAHGAPACAAGACTVGACDHGYADCDHAAGDGCEVSLTGDVANCGACGTVCPAAPHATASCTASGCGTTCVAGWADCNGSAADGCETSVTGDETNCGACGHACGGHETCQGGACTTATCVAGWSDCNGNAADGCEADLTTSAASCGACGNACAFANAGGACVAGSCAMGACAAGYADCNGSAADGCEVALGSDGANCGACGSTCYAGSNATATCSGGACVLACGDGRADCDGNPANGCEADLAVGGTTCGACGSVCGDGLGCAWGSCQRVIPSGAVSWFRGEGNASDALGANDGTMTGNVTFTAGEVGQGFRFDGPPDQPNIGSILTDIRGFPLGSDDRSFALWVRSDDPNSVRFQGIISYGQWAGAFGIVIDGIGVNGAPGVYAIVENNWIWLGSVNPGEWHHVAVTYSGGLLTTYIDGYASNSAGLYVNTERSPFFIGHAGSLISTLGDAPFAGVVDELMVFNRALTPGEVQSIYAAGSGGVAAPCSEAACGGTCADLQNDASNCGACGHACGSGGVCSGGACACVASGTAPCGGTCIDILSDAANCGACGRSCGAGGACSNGACTCTGTTLCYGTCASTATDDANCGACGHACTYANGFGACGSSTCTLAGCQGGYGDCNGTATDGCETSIASDANHCGACGNACTGPGRTGACNGGACTSCAAGFANCNGSATDGCETSLNTAANCGACGNACPSGNTCSDGTCSATACAADPAHRYRADGNANDSAGTLNANFFNGSYATGEFGQAFSLNGSGQYAQLPAALGNFGAGNFTLSLWVNTTTGGNVLSQRNSCWGGPAFHGIDMRMGGGVLFVEIWTSAGYYSVGTPSGYRSLVDGAWHQVALVRQGSSLALNIDGAAAATTTIAGSISDPRNTPVYLGVGRCVCGAPGSNGNCDATPWFNGRLDQVAVYNRALSASELTSSAAALCAP